MEILHFQLYHMLARLTDFLFMTPTLPKQPNVWMVSSIVMHSFFWTYSAWPCITEIELIDQYIPRSAIFTCHRLRIKRKPVNSISTSLWADKVTMSLNSITFHEIHLSTWLRYNIYLTPVIKIENFLDKIHENGHIAFKYNAPTRQALRGGHPIHSK